YPANFSLIAATNPCPCGYGGENENANSPKCTCSDLEKSRYQKKISGPIKDRIDIHVHVQSIAFKALLTQKNGANNTKSTDSITIQQLVTIAREIQSIRYSTNPSTTAFLTNASINNAVIQNILNIYKNTPIINTLERASNQLK